MTILIPAMYLFLVFQQVAVGFADDNSTVAPFNAQSIAIDCGSSGSYKALNNRIWEGDLTSKLFTSQGPNNASIVAQAVNPPTQVSDTINLFKTARLSRSEIKYNIPVTAGQKFIRLHFYPDVYGDLDTSKAYFSVKAAHFTLLRNFSAFLTAGALQTQGVMKEFCLNVEDSDAPNVTLTFSPDPSSSESFAFVNGIEVVSMPTNLYYRTAEDESSKFVGQLSRRYPIGNDTAMEMLYRINVGGADILPANDTGMFRNWDMDNDYITNLGPSVAPVLLPANDSRISYDEVPAYTAPRGVYTTARSTGNTLNKTLLHSYNLTWEFRVDSGFYFLFRLHFCEIEPEIEKPSDRVFYIYIANQIAEDHADVISWSGKQYVPVYQDYVVSTPNVGLHDKSNLSVALHVNPDESQTAYLGAILNGVEIFKLSAYDGNLAGPNPGPLISPPPVAQPSQPRTNGKNGRTVIVGTVCGVVLLSAVVVYMIFLRGRKVKSTKSVDGKSRWGRSSSLPSDLCRYFSLAEIRAATNNFDDVFIVGQGGFGKVYKGYIDNGTTPVAIKRLKPESSQGAHEFRTEIEMLSKLRHLHLVSLIGYCNDDREMILVYEYMARGTLREHLYNGENRPLSWKRRLEICIGAARGLHYLHTGAKHTIIHRDVKTTNILLDEKWEAKVSDFGLSRTGPTSMSKAHVSTVVKGSMGYLDPEYYRRQQLTEKSDVYSFGVVLCEVLCARPPLLRSAEKEQKNLAEWAKSCHRSGRLEEIVDKHLKGKIAAECLRKFGEIAVTCMADDGRERPPMNDVVWGLEFALQLQQEAVENASLIGALGGETEREDDTSCLVIISESSSQDDGKFSCSWEDSSKLLKSSADTKTSSSGHSSDTNQGLSGAVFSEINDPKGR